MSSLFKMDIQSVKGIGAKSAELFRKIGAPTAGALLYIYPKAYEDWSDVKRISDACSSIDTCCIRVKAISPIKHFISQRGKHCYKITCSDEYDSIDILFFNNPGIFTHIKAEKEVLLLGKVLDKSGKYEMICPKMQGIDRLYSLRPIYTQTKELPSWKIEQAVKNSIALLPEKVSETLPQKILLKYSLCSLDFAIRNIHFPNNMDALEMSKRRLAFEEIFIWQIGMSMIKSHARQKTEIKILNDFKEEFYSTLPFQFTDAQKRVTKECIDDLESGFSMNRMLQGDVGSGKTVVAAVLAYNMAKSGYQTAVMAPTELLARQHYNTFKKLFDGSGVNVDLLIGALRKKGRTRTLDNIQLGITDIIIGTHSLISEGVQFKSLGLVITDEQHRFGVNQRAKLLNKGNHPHVLIMSATPIPRSLALTVYGDLDMSVINELPPGRQHVDTLLIDSGKRIDAIEFLKKRIQEGRQAYIVCSSIDEVEDNKDISSVERYIESLPEGILSDYRVAILHGKLNCYEKENVMESFCNGDIDIIISTTVIEVGIDVPNATVMIIENAERFGLSQLHQLRGRVGRGTDKSYCILISESKGEDAVKRLGIMTETNDGFKLAAKDLEIRGSGEFLGMRQHGDSDLKLLSMINNAEIISDAQESVRDIDVDNAINSGELRFIKGRVDKIFESKMEEYNGIVF